MSEKESLDLGKVVGLIMENPALIEQIASLAKRADNQEEEPQMPEEESAVELPKTTEASTEATYSPPHSHRSDRQQLFCALKPYVSKERAKAIDSMLSIADILDMMRSR